MTNTPAPTHSTAFRRTAIVVAVSFLLTQGSGVLASTGTVAQQLAADTAANLVVVSTPGQSNEVTGKMNTAAAETVADRLATLNSLYKGPMKTKIKDMTCLDKIMAISFLSLGSIDIGKIIDALILAAIMALLKAACAVVDKAWDSAMGSLTEMTKIDLGTNGSVNLISADKSGVKAGVTYQAGSSDISQLAGAVSPALIKQQPPTTYGGFPPAPSSANQKQDESLWEKTKNFFK